MRLFTLLSCMVIIGCSSDVPVVNGSTQNVGGAAAHDTVRPDSSSDKGPGVCGPPHHETVTIDGQSIDIDIPVMCDPRYEDKGDPPPEKRDDKWDPIEIPIQSYAVTNW